MCATELPGLAIGVKVRSAPDRGAIVGRVVDTRGRPVAGANIEAAFASGGGSATTGIATTTNEAGAFRLSLPKPEKEQKVSLVVIAQDHGGLDTEYRTVEFEK